MIRTTMRMIAVLALLLLWSGGAGAHAQHALGQVTDPVPLNSDARVDSRGDAWPQLATDGAGNWVVVWDGGDILAAYSSNGGVSWSDPEVVFPSPIMEPRIATDGQGTWIAIGAIPNDGTVFVSRGTETGASAPTWSAPQALNPGGPPWAWVDDGNPTVAYDGTGTWVSIWWSDPNGWIVRSTDGGVTWSAPELFPIGMPELSGNGSGTLIATGPLGSFTTVVSRSTDGGLTWSTPISVTTGTPKNPAASDGAGNWMLVSPYYYLPGSKPPFHVRYARSEDDGVTWTSGTLASTQTQGPSHPDVAGDDKGDWLVVWEAEHQFTDHDIWLARSTDRTVVWSEREQVDDTTGWDAAPRIGRDVGGHWVVVWHSTRTTGGFGFDGDIFISRITLFCDEFVDESDYGALLFEPMCARRWENRAQDRYDSTQITIRRNADDVFYLSSEGDDFAPLVAGDFAEVDGVDSGLGSYAYTSFPPVLAYYAPIEMTLAAQPAHDVTDLIPPGQNTVTFDLLASATDNIYGHTPIYLVRDCGLYVTGEGDEIEFVTHDDSASGTPPEFDVRYGLLSDLQADGDFSQAACLGHFLDTPATLSLPQPPAGDGYYYLVRGLSSCVAQGYGSSGLAPDPRDALDSLPVCP
jgi:hypothetical protein